MKISHVGRYLFGLAMSALLLGGLPTGASAQQTGTITGTVIDAGTRQPLAGVQVFVSGTNRSAATNQEGRFLIPGVSAGQHTLRAAMLGYSGTSATVTVQAGQTVTVEFELEVSAVALDALVINAVTGQAERRRAQGTNVGRVEMQSMEMAPITKVQDVLAGRVAGVTMMTSSGTLGTASRIRIRGANSLTLSNEPVVYVDGIKISTSTGGLSVGGQAVSRLNDIDPNEIENIEILKGPAASALYGTAAANGVMLITTKRGRAGAPRWEAYVEGATFEDKAKYPENAMAYQLNDPSAPLFDADGDLDTSARALCRNYQAAAGSCVQDSVFRFNPLMDSRTRPFSTGMNRRYGINVAGGTDVVRYYIGGDIENGEGVISFNTQDKRNFRANFSANLRDDLEASVNFGYIDSKVRMNNNDNSILSPLINGLLGSYVFYPNLEDGSINPNNYGWGFTLDDLRQAKDQQDVNRLLLSSTVRYTPYSWLTANVTGGLDLVSRHEYASLQPQRLFYSANVAKGYRESQRTSLYNYTLNASLSATFEPMERVISTTTVGANYQNDMGMSTYGFGYGIPEGTESLSATSEQFSVSESYSEIRTIGGYFRQQFAFDDRIFLGASVRTDNNSAFGRNFGFMWYPAVDLSWMVGEESWFPETDLITSLRLRTAYGRSGLRPGYRAATTYFSPVAVKVDGKESSAFTLSGTGNVFLAPEKVDEYELGFDAAFFNNRIGAQFTYYNRESKQALINRRLPPSLGLTTSVLDNMGSIRNSGTELVLDARVFETENVALNLTFTNTQMSNKILTLGQDEPIIINRGEQRHQEGYSAGSYFQPKYVYNDHDGDGLLRLTDVEIDDEADEYIGPSMPTYSRSLLGELTLFRNITISTLFDARGGNYQLDGTTEFRCFQLGCGAVGDPNATLEEQAAFIGTRMLGTVRGYIHKADFIKWREASITFRAPESFGERFSVLRGASLTLAGRNLATWTDYPGLDPEIAEQGAANFNQNEFNTQPPLRYLTARLSFRF